MKEIKKAYRSLSLIWHPDKNRDPEAKKMFYLLNKANDILTDPKKKDNWLKYGNPDGPVGYSMSIALPSFLFNPKYQILVLLAFAAVFLIVIPYMVYRWFKSTEVPADPSGFQLENINYFSPYWIKSIDHREVVSMLARTIEFTDLNKVKSDDEKVELEDLKDIVPETVQNKERFVYAWKIYILYWCHILRVEL